MQAVLSGDCCTGVLAPGYILFSTIGVGGGGVLVPTLLRFALPAVPYAPCPLMPIHTSSCSATLLFHVPVHVVEPLLGNNGSPVERNAPRRTAPHAGLPVEQRQHTTTVDVGKKRLEPPAGALPRGKHRTGDFFCLLSYLYGCEAGGCPAVSCVILRGAASTKWSAPFPPFWG